VSRGGLSAEPKPREPQGGRGYVVTSVEFKFILRVQLTHHRHIPPRSESKSAPPWGGWGGVAPAAMQLQSTLHFTCNELGE